MRIDEEEAEDADCLDKGIEPPSGSEPEPAAVTGPDSEATRLLGLAAAGNAQAKADLVQLLYDELKWRAQRLMRGERGSHTIQPTALVHELYQELIVEKQPPMTRVRFFAWAARAMKNFLIDYARRKKASRRDPGRPLHSLDGQDVAAEEGELDELLDLASGLSALDCCHPGPSLILELSYFGGLSYREIADVQGIDKNEVTRALKVAMAFLGSRLRTPLDELP